MVGWHAYMAMQQHSSLYDAHAIMHDEWSLATFDARTSCTSEAT